MPQDDAKDRAGLFKKMPPNMQKVIHSIGFPDFENMNEDEAEVYELARQGKCMACHSDLSRTALLIVNRFGVVAAYCSGPCMTDFVVIGYLQEQHEDISVQVRMRNAMSGADGDQLQDDTVPDTIGEDPAMNDDEGENDGSS